MRRLRKWFETHIDAIWYDPEPSRVVRCVSFFFLRPCSAVYKNIADVHKQFQLHFSSSFHPKVPVIVVGNLTVGGAGKTPMVMALVDYLKQGGYRPGIVSRGYGGKATSYPLLVTEKTSPEEAGDEAVLLARRTQVPVVVAPKRVKAIQFLMSHADCDIILSDDGLQHWAMKRDIEILVIDGKRRFGNQRYLPAGPLRESITRYKTVDFLVVNEPLEKKKGEYPFFVRPDCFVNVGTGETHSLDFFDNQKVYVLTAIGHPQRFLDVLKALNIEQEARLLPDHHAFIKKDFTFDENKPIVMTEKDAIKCTKFDDSLKNNLFYLKVTSELDSLFKAAFMKKLNQVGIRLEGEALK